MPLNKEAIKRLTADELYGIYASEAFSGQRKEVFKALQKKNALGYENFKRLHQDQGCKTVYVLHGYSDSPFVNLDGIPHSYRHFSFWCRKHGVSSHTLVDVSLPEEPSSLDAETSRYNFTQHIIKEGLESESIVQAWNHFEDYILSWAKDYEGLHYLSDYFGNTRSISPYLQKVQNGVDTLKNHENSNEDSIITTGLLAHLVFGEHERLGMILEGLTEEERLRAVTFCEEMLPKDFLASTTNILESVNWDDVARSQ